MLCPDCPKTPHVLALLFGLFPSDATQGSWIIFQSALCFLWHKPKLTRGDLPMPRQSTKGSDILRGGRAPTWALHPHRSAQWHNPWEPSWFKTCKCCLCVTAPQQHTVPDLFGVRKEVAAGEATWSRSCSWIAGVLLNPCCKRAHGNRKSLHQNSTLLGCPSCGALQRHGNPVPGTGKIQV